ncbi:MAG: hypothetical protein ACKVZ6_12670 [Kineosporiaceae bacterium]|jgi:hypothetical protein
MAGTTVEATLLGGAVLLLLVSQGTLWWRSGRSDPQATWMALVTQLSSLGVLALYLRQTGLAAISAVVGVLAAAGLAGLVSAARTVARRARADGTTWWAAHRAGLHRTLVAVEALVAAVAVVAAVSWASENAGRQFDRKADATLCRLLDDAC